MVLIFCLEFAGNYQQIMPEAPTALSGSKNSTHYVSSALIYEHLVF